MESNNWYNNYQNNRASVSQPGTSYVNVPRRKGVGIGVLIACMLVTALLGGILGGVIIHFVDRGSSRTVMTVPEQSSLESAPQEVVSVPVSDDTLQNVPESAPTVSQPSLSSMLTSGVAGSVMGRAQVVEACAPSVVGIDVEYTVTNNPASYYGFFYGFNQQGPSTATGSGSGVIVTEDGYIVTCNHVVESATKISVVLNDESSYDAEVIGVDPRYDLAVIKIDAKGLTPAVLGDSDMLTVGEDVVAIGNPLGELRGTATGGMVSALNRGVTVESVNMSLIQHDAAVSPGSSGGGLFSTSGSLIGIVNAKASSNNAEGIGFAIPVNDVRTIISDLIEHGYVTGRAYLGVIIQNVTLQSERGGRFGGFFGSTGYTSCVQVSQVVEGGSAAQAGIQPGDLILYVGDVRITDTNTLSTAINAYNAGDTAELTIQRSGTQSKISVTFGEYAPEN